MEQLLAVTEEETGLLREINGLSLTREAWDRWIQSHRADADVQSAKKIRFFGNSFVKV